VLDLNHILFFLAIVSPLAVLARAWRPSPRLRAWRVAAFAVLIVATLAWMFFRRQAGYLAGGAWLLLLFIPAIGLRRVADLASRHHYTGARRLARLLHLVHPSAELRHEVELLRLFEKHPESAAGQPSPWPVRPPPPRLRNAPAVLSLVLLNAAVFLFEIVHPHWQEPAGLHRLGALEPAAVIYGHEYWRLFTALFLHFDPVHLLFNLFALYVLGPPLERAIGAIRFYACYAIAGFGSSAGVVALARLGVVHADQLVGASGCVMGIVGAWGAFLLRHRHMPLARQRLVNVIMIVIIQTAFDLSTPQVSLSAHLCGLVTGFLVGLLIAPKRESVN
jgi:membrane associated rhomboid family serine protease